MGGGGGWGVAGGGCALSGHWSHALYRILAEFTSYAMINVWDTVTAFIRLRRMFLSTVLIFEKRIGLVAMYLLYIRFTYQTQVN